MTHDCHNFNNSFNCHQFSYPFMDANKSDNPFDCQQSGYPLTDANKSNNLFECQQFDNLLMNANKSNKLFQLPIIHIIIIYFVPSFTTMITQTKILKLTIKIILKIQV
jgi:hypothetical protein